MTKSGFDIEEGALTDLIADAISGSMDYDWTARDGARSTYAALVPILTEIRELRAENARLKEMTATNRQAWDNALELGIIPERHRNTVQIMSDGCRAALGEPQ